MIKQTVLILSLLIAFFSVSAQDKLINSKIEHHLNLELDYLTNRTKAEDAFLKLYFERKFLLESNKNEHGDFISAKIKEENELINKRLSQKSLLYQKELVLTEEKISPKHSTQSSQKELSKTSSIPKNEIQNHSTQKSKSLQTLTTLNEVKNVENPLPKNETAKKVVSGSENKISTVVETTLSEPKKKNKDNSIGSENKTSDLDSDLKEKTRVAQNNEVKVARTENNVASLNNQDERTKLIKLYNTKFDETVFLVQIASLEEKLTADQIAQKIGLNETIVMYKVEKYYKYFVGEFDTYSSAKDKVKYLQKEGIGSFVVVKSKKQFISPHLFFSDKP
jgi:sulfur relay (sulfurtransferase) DsrC/TusE family protein